MSSYESWRELAASWGLLYFGLIFLAAVAYAYWPSRCKMFEDAAKTPLRED